MDPVSVQRQRRSEGFVSTDKVFRTLLPCAFFDVPFKRFSRWATLRATEGWAALQHHSVLKASITVYPPSGDTLSAQVPPQLHVQLVQGSFFTVLPSNTSEDTQSEPFVPKWYSGNIYEMEQAPPQILDFPILPSTTSPTTYDIFVSGDYEVNSLNAGLCYLLPLILSR